MQQETAMQLIQQVGTLDDYELNLQPARPELAAAIRDNSSFGGGRSTLYAQKELGDWAIRIQVDGMPLDELKLKKRNVKKYLKNKAHIFQEQGVHFAIGESNQPYFSGVTRMESTTSEVLVSLEERLRVGMAALMLDMRGL